MKGEGPHVDLEVWEELCRSEADLVCLGAALSLAAVVRRPLVRDVRMLVLPHSHAEIEHALWFGPLVEARGIDSFAFRPGFLTNLRAALLDWAAGRPDGSAMLERLRELVKLHSDGAAPALRLEQDIVWTVLCGQDPAVADDGMRSVLLALGQPGRQGIATWVREALPRLPPTVRSRALTRQVGNVAEILISAQGTDYSVPDGVTADWRSWVHVAKGARMPVYLQWVPGVLTLSADPIKDSPPSLMAPRAKPMALGVVCHGDDSFHMVCLAVGRPVKVRGHGSRFTFQLADGGIVEIDMQSPRAGNRAVRRHLSPSEWREVFAELQLGQVVQGEVFEHKQQGFLVSAKTPSGKEFPCFLPGSHVSDRPVSDWGAWLGAQLSALVLQLDPERSSVRISHKNWLAQERARQAAARRAEDERLAEARRRLLASLVEGQVVKGRVKNIADFGVFVDLGGIDGLLHITDMSWGRVNHPSEMVELDDEVEVKVLKVDRERERIALGMKQKSASPWENIADKYPVDRRVAGEVVNLMSYGAFVKLEDGVEGLVHISEMSWTKRVNHPNELVKVGDRVEVVVLGVDTEKQMISLSMKQAAVNPWDHVAQRYPPGTVIRGKVRNLTNYGAFIELEEGIDGLLHVTDMSWTRKITDPSEVVAKGVEIACLVLSVDQAKRRIALGLKQLQADPWNGDIPARYHMGDSVPGTVTKITNFGAFVELQPGLEALLHVSELTGLSCTHPGEVLGIGQAVQVRVLKIDPEARKISLSLVRMLQPIVPPHGVAHEIPGSVSGGLPPMPRVEQPANAAAAARWLREFVERRPGMVRSCFQLSSHLGWDRGLMMRTAAGAFGSPVEWEEPLAKERLLRVAEFLEGSA